MYQATNDACRIDLGALNTEELKDLEFEMKESLKDAVKRDMRTACEQVDTLIESALVMLPPEVRRMPAKQAFQSVECLFKTGPPLGQAGETLPGVTAVNASSRPETNEEKMEKLTKAMKTLAEVSEEIAEVDASLPALMTEDNAEQRRYRLDHLASRISGSLGDFKAGGDSSSRHMMRSPIVAHCGPASVHKKGTTGGA